MPLIRSIIFGVVTAVLLWGGTMLLAIGSMAGPTDFRLTLIAIVPAIILFAAFTKSKGWRRGLAAGLLFALPVVITSFALPSLMFGPSSHPSVTTLARQLRFVGIVTAIIAAVCFCARGADYEKLPNHARQRTRHDATVGNPRVPSAVRTTVTRHRFADAGSLSLRR
jgi:hypothetical protein